MRPIKKDQIQRMRAEYDKAIRNASTQRLKQMFPDRPWAEDTSSVWVSRKEINALLDANKANGLRIYYGCHHESTSQDPKMDYLGMHTLIFVATKDTVNPDNPTTQTSADVLNDPGTVGATEYDGDGGEYFPLCPPVCP